MNGTIAFQNDEQISGMVASHPSDSFTARFEIGQFLFQQNTVNTIRGDRMQFPITARTTARILLTALYCPNDVA